jgi:hypothetical protein
MVWKAEWVTEGGHAVEDIHFNGMEEVDGRRMKVEDIDLGGR